MMDLPSLPLGTQVELVAKQKNGETLPFVDHYVEEKVLLMSRRAVWRVLKEVRSYMTTTA